MTRNVAGQQLAPVNAQHFREVGMFANTVGNEPRTGPMTSVANRLRARASPVLADFMLVLAAPAVHDTPAHAATEEQCQNGWQSAPAYSSCDADWVNVVAVGCQISAPARVMTESRKSLPYRWRSSSSRSCGTATAS